MKRLILLIVTLAAAATRLFAAHLCPSTGRVVDEQGKAVEYATVVLLKGTEQVAGMATDAEGRFALKAAPGEYTLLIQYLGFDPVKKPVRVEQENHLGDFVMRTSATGIESVEVKARLVRREADRFVVDVANAPAAIGKDGIELLARAPGVWIERGENINQRQERLEGLRQRPRTAHGAGTAADLPAVAPGRGDSENRGRAHLGRRLRRRLRREASSASRLKKRRENGVNGSVAFNTTQGEIVHRYNPSGQHQPAFGPRGLLRLGMGIFRKGRDHHRRADALRGRGQGAERTFVDERPQPQPRGQRRRGGRDRRQEQRRRGVRVLAQPGTGSRTTPTRISGTPAR